MTAALLRAIQVWKTTHPRETEELVSLLLEIKKRVKTMALAHEHRNVDGEWVYTLGPELEQIQNLLKTPHMLDNKAIDGMMEQLRLDEAAEIKTNKDGTAGSIDEAAEIKTNKGGRLTKAENISTSRFPGDMPTTLAAPSDMSTTPRRGSQMDHEHKRKWKKKPYSTSWRRSGSTWSVVTLSIDDEWRLIAVASNLSNRRV